MAVHYFETRAKRMQYKMFKEKGNHQIGSSVTESAFKNLLSEKGVKVQNFDGKTKVSI